MQHGEGSVEKEPQKEGGNLQTSGVQGLKPWQTGEEENGIEPEPDSELGVHKEAEELER